MVRNESGFTIVEAVVAILLLTIGFAGVAKATAGMTRMLSGGDRATTATIYARERLELLRATGCTSMAAGSQQLDNVYDLNWAITTPAGSKSRRVELYVSYPGNRGTRTDTLRTSVACK